MTDDPGDGRGLCGFADGTGRRCAGAIGLVAGAELGSGFDGRTYALSNPPGTVLKVTRRPVEAAFACLLVREAGEGRAVEGFPAVLGVSRFQVGDAYEPLWGIVREAVTRDPEEGMRSDLLRLAREWASARARGAPAPDLRSSPLSGVARSLEALRDRHGLVVTDLAACAVGITATGRAVIRDLGRVSAAPDVVGRLLDALPPPVEVPAEAPARAAS